MTLRHAVSRVSAALIAAVLPMSLLTAAQPAGAVQTDEAYGRPSDGVYTFRGHGYGHGIGMSQWGAQGAALSGLSAAQIMDFYYPGTYVGPRNAQTWIRVRLDSLGNASIPFANTSSLQVKEANGSLVPVARLTASAEVTLAPIPAQADGRDMFLMSRNSPQEPWTANAALKAPVTLFGDSNVATPITLFNANHQQRPYKGAIVVERTSLSSLRTVNHLDLEDYIKGVVPREAWPSWHPNALQAQALAARSFAVWEMDHQAAWEGDSDTCDTTSCQVYGGLSGQQGSTDAATDATWNQVVTDPATGRAALTMFSASNGGHSVASNKPYLIARPDPYDGVSTSSSNPHNWTKQVAVSDIENAYPIGSLQRIEIISRDGNGEWGGRVTALRLVGTGGTATPTPSEFRFALGLRSTWFLPSSTVLVDVPSDRVFYSDIMWAYTYGITTGYADGSFQPGAAVQRDAMAAFLYRLAGSPAYTPPASSPFVDVPTGRVFYKEICWLKEQGISTGWSDGTFRPEEPVLRDAMVVLLHRFDGKYPSLSPTIP